MPARLEIDALRALLAIEAHGGVTRAAEALAVSQSAVSHKIRRLEQSLDRPLLARRAGGPLFTDAGSRLLDYARRLTDLHDEALAALSLSQAAGTIRLGMTEDSTSSGLARILGRFTRLYPGIRVRTRVAQSLTLQGLLDSGEIDLALMQVFTHQVRPDDAVLFTDSLHWVRAPGLELDPEAPVPFISFDPACFYKQWAESEGSAAGHRFETVMECSSAAGVVSAVMSGLGAALLNGMHVTPQMQIMDGPFPAPPPLTFLARCRSASRPAPVAALLREITREAAPPVPLQPAG